MLEELSGVGLDHLPTAQQVGPEEQLDAFLLFERELHDLDVHELQGADRVRPEQPPGCAPDQRQADLSPGPDLLGDALDQRGRADNERDDPEEAEVDEGDGEAREPDSPQTPADRAGQQQRGKAHRHHVRPRHEQAVEEKRREGEQNEGPQEGEPDTRTPHREKEQQQQRGQVEDAGQLYTSHRVAQQGEGGQQEVEPVPDVGRIAADD